MNKAWVWAVLATVAGMALFSLVWPMIHKTAASAGWEDVT